MKKLVSMLLALLLILGCLTFASAEEPVNVKLMVPSSHLEFMEKLIVPFNEAHTDVQIVLDGTASDWGGVATKLVTMLAGGEDVDIAAVSTSFYPQFAAMGQLLDITEHAKETYSEEEYYWSVFDGLMIDNKLYCVPISLYTLLNYYNKDLYDEAGIAYPPMGWGEDAWSIDEWKETADKLSHGEGLDRVYGAFVDLKMTRTAFFLYPEGLDFFGEDLRPQFDNPRIREIHQMIYDMIHVDKTIPDSELTNTTSVTQLFADGKLANYIEGTWSHASIADSNINFGVCPVPGGTSMGFVDVYIPLATTKHPEQTMQVLDYLISYEACVMKYENNQFGPQVNRKASEACKDTCFSGLSKEEIDCVFASLDNSKPMTVFPEWAEFNDDAVKPICELMKTGEYTLDQGFDELQEIACSMLGF